MGSITRIYDSGRDNFLATATSKPPSKFDSIEHLVHDVHKNSTIAFKTASLRDATNNATTGGQRTEKSTCSSTSNATTTGGWSGGGNSTRSNSEVTLTGSWKAEVSGRPYTAPRRSAVGEGSSFKTPAGVPKKFFWGPKVACQRQEVDRNVRRTNNGEPATFAMAVDECASTVSTIRSSVPRRVVPTLNDDDSTIGASSSAYAGMESHIRTSITDRIHDGIYDTDTAHKASLAGRVQRGHVRSPHIACHRKRFAGVLGRPGQETATQRMEPGYYDTVSGIDATSISSTFLSLPREKCDYDSYIRRGLGQTTGPTIGPGKYGWEPATELAQKSLAFSTTERWTERPSTTGRTSSNRGPWDDVGGAWGRGGYIERAIPRDCKSYLPVTMLWCMNNLDLDHLGKETFATAMRQNPKRYAASFSNTQEPDWRIIGDPDLGPGTYDVERAKNFTFPAPLGGAGDADPARPSLAFRNRCTPFDTRCLADGYKTLRPRFSTPRSSLYASEPSGPKHGAANAGTTSATVVERTVGTLMHAKDAGRKCRSPAAKAAAVKAEAAADPLRIGGRDSRFVRMKRPSVLDPVRESCRRRAALLSLNPYLRKR